MVKFDGSDVGVGTVLSQQDPTDQKLLVLSFSSTPAE